MMRSGGANNGSNSLKLPSGGGAAKLRGSGGRGNNTLFDDDEQQQQAVLTLGSTSSTALRAPRQGGGGLPSTTAPSRQPPRATTVEEDIEEEVKEEKMYALDRAMETLTTDAVELITDPRRMIKSQPLKDIRREETRRIREHQLKEIAKKTKKGRRTFDLVEDMFQRAVERRMRAHLKIASDPPADRLVGTSMLQYIPAAMLKDQEKQTEAFIQAKGIDDDGDDDTGAKKRAWVRGRVAPHLTHPVPLLNAPKKRGGGAEGDPNSNRPPSTLTLSGDDERSNNAIVFLTEMDDPDVVATDDQNPPQGEVSGSPLPQDASESGAPLPLSSTVGKGGDSSGSFTTSGPGTPTSSLSQAERNKQIDEMLRLESLLSPSERRRKKRMDLDSLYHVPEERVREWRELGYNVMYVAHKDPVRAGRKPHSAGPHLPHVRGEYGAQRGSRDEDVSDPPRYISSRERDRRGTQMWSECSWMKLAPLPPVCLLQRRLAVEDMALEELLGESRRYQRFKPSVPIPPSSSATSSNKQSH